ncbi:MFS transporter [Streptomyces sp. NPDC006655]|uniref:MFS transporter n=1 Tax=Streptomyces sp. NPDC006655 TaxID=3156898 RepID=UPI0034537995
MSSSTTPSAPPPTAAASSTTAEPAGLGARLALIAVALMWPTQLLSLSGLLGGSAQASVALHFHTADIGWFLLVNALVGTVILPFVVKAADLYGKRNTMIAITVLGLVGDIVAALATNYETLLIGRAIAGFYAPIAALAYASVRELFPPKQVGTASGFIGSGIAFVALGGPFLTGWLLDSFGFRGVLWALAIATAVGLVLLLTVVPETPHRVRDTKFNWLSGLLLGAGAASVIYGVGKGGEWGWTDAGTLGFILGGVLAVILFVVIEKKSANPLFDLTMMSRRPVWSVMVATSLIAGTIFGTGVITQLLVLFPKIPTVSDGLGMTATHFAVIGIPSSILILLVGFGTGALVRRIDARIPLGLGAALACLGFVLSHSWHYTSFQLFILGPVSAFAMGMIVASMPVLIIQAVDPDEQATASGLQNLMQGVTIAVITQLVYVVLAQDSRVVQGTRFYLDAGYKNAMLLGAGLAAVGLLTVALIPKLKRTEDVTAGEALSHS